MASALKTLINHSLKGVSTKYLKNYANWYRIKREKLDAEELGKRLQQNKRAMDINLNREGIYKWFIENFSKRTYRCPVKRKFGIGIDVDLIPKLNFL
jgi:hypothetical protein